MAGKIVDLAGDAAGGLYSVFGGGGEPIGTRVPLIGSLGKQIGERSRAGIDYLVNKGDVPFSDLLKHVRDQEAADQDRFAKEHPGGNLMRNIIGGIGSAMVPVPGAGMKGLGGAAVRVAGAITGAGTDTLLRTEDVKKGKQAATVGGIIQTGLEAIPVVGRALAPLANKTGEVLESAGQATNSFANERAVKAATGQNKTVLKNIAKTKGFDDVGETLLNGENPVVTFGAGVNKIKDRASKAADKTWEAIEGIYQHADQAAGGAAIDGKDIAEKIIAHATSIEPLPQNQGVIDNLMNTAAYFEKKGPMTLSHAQELKNNFVFKMTNPQTHALGLDGNNAVRGAITESMGNAIEKIDPTIAEAWRGHMNAYGALATTAGAASDRAVANISNRFISPSDYAAGIGGGLIEGAGKDVGDAAKGLTMAVLTLGHKFLRERGSSMMAVSAKNLAQILETSPQALGSAYGLLSKAATESPAALEATHALLMETDPGYRRLVSPEPAKPAAPEIPTFEQRDQEQKRSAIMRRSGN